MRRATSQWSSQHEGGQSAAPLGGDPSAKVSRSRSRHMRVLPCARFVAQLGDLTAERAASRSARRRPAATVSSHADWRSTSVRRHQRFTLTLRQCNLRVVMPSPPPWTGPTSRQLSSVNAHNCAATSGRIVAPVCVFRDCSGQQSNRLS